MKNTILLVTIATIIVLACTSSCYQFISATSTKVEYNILNEDDIRCKVCERAIAYVWDEGYKLRQHCRHGEASDPRCDYNNIHHFAVEEMVSNVCDKLPKTHKQIEGSEFDLELHEDPQHPEEVAKSLRSTCVKWLHDQHGLDQVTLYIYANLEAGKNTETILHSLQQRYCGKHACNARYTQSTNVEDPGAESARWASWKENHDL